LKLENNLSLKVVWQLNLFFICCFIIVIER
jgi:hypothetical protein